MDFFRENCKTNSQKIWKRNIHKFSRKCVFSQTKFENVQRLIQRSSLAWQCCLDQRIYGGKFENYLVKKLSREKGNERDIEWVKKII